MILAHADRNSILAAILLARDVRQLEGIWIYPQSELMTFFRGVATDLRENTPIFVVGFSATPARDAIHAASLYRDRLVWFDHHVWPPEDLGGMNEAIGEAMLHVEAGEIAKTRPNPKRKRALRRFFRRKRLVEKTLGQLVDKKEVKNNENN